LLINQLQPNIQAVNIDLVAIGKVFDKTLGFLRQEFLLLYETLTALWRVQLAVCVLVKTRRHEESLGGF